MGGEHGEGSEREKSSEKEWEGGREGGREVGWVGR